MALLALPLLVMLVTHAAPKEAPGVAGVFRAGTRVIQIATTIEDEQYWVQPWEKMDQAVAARRLEGLPFSLVLKTDEVLEFSKDYSRFTVSAGSSIFGETRGVQPFVRLTKAEIEKLVKADEQANAEKEGRALLKALHVAEMSHFAEYDTFSADPKTLGFSPEGCPDGTRAKAGKDEVAGCQFVVKIEVKGEGVTGQYTGTAIGKRVKLSISSEERPGTPRGAVRVEK